MSALGLKRPLYLADTFTGLVKSGPMDPNSRDGWRATPSKPVGDLLCAQSVEATILEGIFPDATADAVSGSIAFCHIDVETRAGLPCALPQQHANALSEAYG